MAPELMSRFRKERLIKEMSEDDFRDVLVRPLLLRLGYKDGRDLCGPSEHGKDALFYEESKLGTRDYLAVQTKTGNLNLASSASSNLVTAITQIQTALQTPYNILNPRQRIYPNKVLLCASGKINEPAKSHILETVKSPNVEFLDLDELIEKVDAYFPELWIGLEADLAPYFKAIKELVLGESPTSATVSVADQALARAASDSVFVPLNVFKEVVKIRRRRGKVTRAAEIQEFPVTSLLTSRSRKLLLLGDAGSGKSTSLLRCAFVLATAAQESLSDYRVPILLKATDIAARRPADLAAHCDETTRILAKTDKPSFTVKDLQDGKVVVFIDSLDEVGLASDREFVVRCAASFTDRYPEVQVVISSRPYRFLDLLPELQTYERLYMSPMTWREAEKLIEYRQKDKKLPAQYTRDVLRKLEKIHGIELNPLLVNVFAATSEIAKQDIPANITELFKKFTELMLGRWDEQKGLQQQFQAPLKDFVVRKLAFQMHQRRRTSMLRDEALDIIRTELSSRGYEADVDKLTSEIVSRSGLFRSLDGAIEFRHQLIQEFFAGRAIDSTAFAESVVKDEWWRRALVFYFGDNPGQIERLKAVTQFVSTLEPKEIFEAAETVGLALQACYLAQVDAKIDIWKWVVQALSVSEAASIQAADPNNERPWLTYIGAHLSARDSVALSNLVGQIGALKAWREELDQAGNPDERRSYWTIIGLIESGETDAAFDLCKEDLPKDPKLVLGIHLSATLAYMIRPIEGREAAKRICELIAPKVDPIRIQMLDEIKSELLEMKHGAIEIVEEEVEK